MLLLLFFLFNKMNPLGLEIVRFGANVVVVVEVVEDEEDGVEDWEDVVKKVEEVLLSAGW